MNANNNNKTTPHVQKHYNPKSNTPAVYIPCWLSQVPDSKLSLGAKIVYGRIAQWANHSGEAHRTVLQLASELGMTLNPVKRYLKELREVGLIEIFQKQKGGMNYYRFYEHEWMYEPLNKNFNNYGKEPVTPSPKQGLPQPDIGPTPSPKQGPLKYKEVKEINNKALCAEPACTLSPIPTPKPNMPAYGITELLADNPHEIPEQMLADWLEVRRVKRSKVTKTAWDKINKTLIQIQAQCGIAPKEAFETMVASGWQSIQLKYFKQDEENKNTKNNNEVFF